MNLPNKISLSRIILIPVMIFFYLASFIPDGIGIIIASAIFIIAACTDFIDGYIARSRNMVTNLGKFLDSIADKMLLTCAFLLVVFTWSFPIPAYWGLIMIIIMLLRDMMINMLRQIGAANNVVIAADKSGKIKAIVQDIAIPFLLVVPALKILDVNKIIVGIFEYTGLVLLIISTILCVTSGISYIVKNKQVFKNNN